MKIRTGINLPDNLILSGVEHISQVGFPRLHGLISVKSGVVTGDLYIVIDIHLFGTFDYTSNLSVNSDIILNDQFDDLYENAQLPLFKLAKTLFKSPVFKLHSGKDEDNDYFTVNISSGTMVKIPFTEDLE